MRTIDATQLRCNVRGKDYWWSGCFGAVIKSFESGVSPGDIRSIGGRLLEAYIVRSRGWFKHPEVSWCFVEDVDMETIRAFKKAVFGVD